MFLHLMCYKLQKSADSENGNPASYLFLNTELYVLPCRLEQIHHMSVFPVLQQDSVDLHNNVITA